MTISFQQRHLWPDSTVTKSRYFLLGRKNTQKIRLARGGMHIYICIFVDIYMVSFCYHLWIKLTTNLDLSEVRVFDHLDIYFLLRDEKVLQKLVNNSSCFEVPFPYQDHGYVIRKLYYQWLDIKFIPLLIEITFAHIFCNDLIHKPQRGRGKSERWPLSVYTKLRLSASEMESPIWCLEFQMQFLNLKD